MTLVGNVFFSFLPRVRYVILSRDWSRHAADKLTVEVGSQQF